MAKSKNHTAHNQSRKAHRNPTRKPSSKMRAAPSLASRVCVALGAMVLPQRPGPQRSPPSRAPSKPSAPRSQNRANVAGSYALNGAMRRSINDHS